MTSARALVGIGSLLVATTVPATLLGGCTKGMGTSTVSMAQPAPRARVTTGATSYTPVTDQRLVSPEAENWLMYRRTYDGWGYSPLEQINTANAKDLVPVWSFSTGVAEGHQAPPIVNNGIMFVSTPQNQVLDARTGQPAWKTFTIPAPGEPGSNTWKGDSWKTGGASVWITGSYDPQLNLTYWGTGNGAQWMGDQRPGDNLYSSSVIALEPDTGKQIGRASC